MQFSAARRLQAPRRKLEEREKATAGCPWSPWSATSNPGDFVYPPPRWVVVDRGLYQKHGQPYARITADFLGLLLK